MPEMERIKIRGLARGPAWAFAVWGSAVLLKGAYDLFGGGQPEANYYSPKPWMFVTRAEWTRYASFEAVYGLACLVLARLLFVYARSLPETLSRPRPPAIDPLL